MQMSFSEAGYAAKKKVTRRDRFLAEIEAKLLALIEPFYPKEQGPGRPPIDLERMLRMYVVRNCLGLSDEGMEDAIYDSQAIRRFVAMDLMRECAPDATTRLAFRRLLEDNGLTQSSSTPSTPICPTNVCCCATGRWWMRRSLRLRPRPRTERASATPRCTRRRRVISGTLA